MPAPNAAMRNNPAPPRFAAVGLARSFGGLKAVDHVSFSIEAGEILGILGPNGAGKSTLINLVSGLTAAHAGSVQVDGIALDGMPLPARARAGLLRSFQNTRPSDEQTAREYLRVAAAAPHRRAQQYGVDELLSRFDLAGYAQSIIADLPYGVQKMIGLAAVALCRPRVLFLDEPFQGVAEGEIARLAQVIRHFQAQGVAIGIVEHNVRSVLDICSRVLVMESGAVIYEGPGEGALRDDAVRTAYLGTRFTHAHA